MKKVDNNINLCLNVEDLKDIIENILIKSYRGFLDIASHKNIDDEYTVRIYFFNQGLRDALKDDQILKEEWNLNKIDYEVRNMIKILSRYLNNQNCKNDIFLLLKSAVELYKKKTGIDLSINIIHEEKLNSCNLCRLAIQGIPQQKCKYCGQYYCDEHILPEEHDCGIIIKSESKPKKNKITSFIKKLFKK